MRATPSGVLRAVVGIGISLVFVYLALAGVDLARTLSLLETARPAWLALAAVFVVCDLACRALRWQILMGPIRHVPLRRLSGYMLIGYLANNLLPARLGEVVRSHYLGDREGISRSATLGTVVVERVVDTVVLVGIGAAAILVLHIRGVVASAVLVGVALSGLLVVALAVALAAHRLPGASRAAGFFLGRWPRGHGMAVRLRGGLQVAAVPRTLFLATILSVAAWSFTVLMVLAAGQALGIQLTVGQGALLAAGTNLATAVPSGPGYLGTFEYAGQTIAVAFGLAAADGLALALLIHFLALVISSLGGSAALFRLGWSRRNSASSGRAAPSVAAMEPAETAGDQASTAG